MIVQYNVFMNCTVYSMGQGMGSECRVTGLKLCPFCVCIPMYISVYVFISSPGNCRSAFLPSEDSAHCDILQTQCACRWTLIEKDGRGWTVVASVTEWQWKCLWNQTEWQLLHKCLLDIRTYIHMMMCMYGTLPLWWSTLSSCVSNPYLIFLCLLHSQHSLRKTFQSSSNLFSSREHTWRTSGQQKAALCPKWRYEHIHQAYRDLPRHTHNKHTVFDMLEQRSPPKAGLSASIYVRISCVLLKKLQCVLVCV